MTNQTASGGRWMGSDFRVGRILDRTISAYRGNFLQFSAVTLAASAAPVLVATYGGSWSGFPIQTRDATVIFITAITAVLLALFSQSIIVHGAFQVLRSRPVNLLESTKIGLRRFFPVLVLAIFVVLAISVFFIGVSIVIAVAASSVARYPNVLSFVSPLIISLIGFLALIVVGLMLVARWFIVIPVCMVERLGPWRSLTRSAGLTQGYRWRVVGIILLLFVPALIVDTVMNVTMTALGGRMVQLIASLLGYAIFSAFFAILVVVTYYELRSSKDGADIEQIATVFD